VFQVTIDKRTTVQYVLYGSTVQFCTVFWYCTVLLNTVNTVLYSITVYLVIWNDWIAALSRQSSFLIIINSHLFRRLSHIVLFSTCKATNCTYSTPFPNGTLFAVCSDASKSSGKSHNPLLYMRKRGIKQTREPAYSVRYSVSCSCAHESTVERPHKIHKAQRQWLEKSTGKGRRTVVDYCKTNDHDYWGLLTADRILLGGDASDCTWKSPQH